ncbi:hypothetical protein EVAR_34154_1 [Eumeta japonica]|uniref:Uncharacterized protein n=1 Tax=Eumeta variegata TaxID=151549 RepID=A0A4C1ZXD4_EUMVA|nr:hypothetical protein EVAR_34154_1 [Eumeta japonica]
MNRTREVYGPKANTARDHVAEMEKILGMQNEVDEMLFNSVDDSNTEELEEELNGLMLEPISPSSGGDNDKNKEVKGEFMAGPSQKASPVKKPDVTMRRLLSLERKLTAQAEKFTEKAERTLEQARVAIKRRNRVVAINHLRRRRFYLKKVTSSVKVLENVKHLKYRLMQNEVDAAAVDVCRCRNSDVRDRYGLKEDVVTRAERARCRLGAAAATCPGRHCRSSASSCSKPSGSSTTFHKAPGGERYKDARSSWPDFDSSADSDIEDLERRLRNLRGLNS